MKKSTWKLIDWTDSKNYAHIGEDSPDEVYAWEFLRRNPQYQNDFSEYEQTGKFLGYTRYTLTSDGKYMPHHEDMRDWYELSHESKNYDPKNAAHPIFNKGNYPRLLQKDDYHRFDATTDPENNLLELGQEEITVVLSASHNLDHQISQIKNLLNNKNSAFRRRKEIYLRYLRLLDAYSMGASEDEILSTLYQDDDACDYSPRSILHSNLKAAKKLRDYSYKKLLAT